MAGLNISTVFKYLGKVKYLLRSAILLQYLLERCLVNYSTLM